jgi:hypothetical protein
MLTRLLIFALLAAPAFAESQRITFAVGDPDPARDPKHFAYGPEVAFDSARGTVRLAKSVLVADEIGATDYHQTLNLTDRVLAKKTFELETADAESAELLLFGSAGDVRVNGESVGKPERLPSTGWFRLTVPPKLLRAGANDVVLKGPGQILIEPTGKPGRSARSTDGGQTWTTADVGHKGHGPGEFVVRLRLGRYAKSGWVKTPILDLWPTADGIARPGRLGTVKTPSVGKSPDGTSIHTHIRLGPTPEPGDRWTSWAPLDKDYTPPMAADGFRWAQLRFELATTRPLITPELPARFVLDYDFTPGPAPTGKVRLVSSGPTTARDALPLSVPFVYQEPSARLARLRERHKLDQVIAGGKTEMEQLMLLRHWVRNQWHTAWEGGSAAWMPPWDALVIFDCMDRPDCLTMCTHYSVVFTQCCLALGWTARHCILDHHCTAEVNVNQHRKWVMMDAGNSKERPDCTLHFERAGIPLSALELHEAHRTGKTADITVCFTPPALMDKVAALCRPAPASAKVGPRPDTIPAADLPKYPVCGLANYRRYAFPARNNYLASPLPGEAYQGWSEYFYDGYCWVGDSPDRPERSPEYSRNLIPDRPQDIDWSLNWTRAHLATTNTPGELRVTLQTRTPNLARLEIRRGTEWKPTPPEFAWKLHPGKNVLTVRSVNTFDRPGPEETVEVEYTPAK